MNKNKKPLLLPCVTTSAGGAFLLYPFPLLSLLLHNFSDAFSSYVYLEATPLSSYRFFKSFMAMCSESLIQVS